MDPVSQGVVGAAFAQTAARRTTLATVAWYGALGGMASATPLPHVHPRTHARSTCFPCSRDRVACLADRRSFDEYSLECATSFEPNELIQPKARILL